MLAFLVVGVFVVFVGAAVWFGRGHVDGGCGGGGCGGGGGD
jgi:hypothetical protein